MAAVYEIMRDGLREILLVRERTLDSVEPVVQHDDIAELMEAVSGFVQSDIFFALYSGKEFGEFLTL